MNEHGLFPLDHFVLLGLSLVLGLAFLDWYFG